MSHQHDGQTILDGTVSSTPSVHDGTVGEQPESSQVHDDIPRVENISMGYPPTSPPSTNRAHCEKEYVRNKESVAGGIYHPSQPSVDGRGNTYPEGGLRAWLSVYGSFSGMTAGFGLMNTIGTFQAYLSTHQLSKEDPSTMGWIFSIYTFLSFFCGIQIGPLFDAKGPRGLVVAGTVCLVVGTFGIAESTGMSCTLL